ncbi:acyl-CoA dehydrogenase family protein [Demequina sp. SYSU T00192]|uniref:Acyl-CoA dehydrogenase family protein n=1 Tax=Demequina litoralis TaxID=3051660 RepID=A0ABT8G681_9MICO|nr:acyl-CoA dehydrogenase family protein [Demequina sp. SYSU T00192]MDN4474655.1 acyl-CoA dehydrogenase family protein [Demequina sp. SYSU T00192]
MSGAVEVAQTTAELAARTRRFVRDVVVPAEPPAGSALDPATRLDLQRRAREAGVFAPHVPVELGGLGLPLADWSPVFQEAGYSPIGPAVLNCMAPDEGNMLLLERIATPEQRERYLAPLAAGDVRSCFAMTEPHPGAGSDPGALATLAHRIDGGWLLEGEKRFISGADEAAFAIVMARTPELGDDAATMLLVPMDAAGVEIGHAIRTLETAITGGHPHVRFSRVRVADEDVLGTPGQAFRHAQARLGPARLTHCMRWLGLARRAQDTALDRVRTRELFGSPLGDLGIAQGLLADSEIDIATSAAVVDWAARTLTDDARAGATASSVAKVHVSEAVGRVIDRAVQLCGGDGVTLELPLLAFLNEVRPFRVYDGSSETHRWAIARRAVARRRAEVGAGEAVLDRAEGAR